MNSGHIKFCAVYGEKMKRIRAFFGERLAVACFLARGKNYSPLIKRFYIVLKEAVHSQIENEIAKSLKCDWMLKLEKVTVLDAVFH